MQGQGNPPECQRFANLWHEGGLPCPCTKSWLIIFLLPVSILRTKTHFLLPKTTSKRFLHRKRRQLGLIMTSRHCMIYDVTRRSLKRNCLYRGRSRLLGKDNIVKSTGNTGKTLSEVGEIPKWCFASLAPQNYGIWKVLSIVAYGLYLSCGVPLSLLQWKRDSHMVCLQWNVSQCFQIRTLRFKTQINSHKQYIFDTNNIESEYAVFSLFSIYALSRKIIHLFA